MQIDNILGKLIKEEKVSKKEIEQLLLIKNEEDKNKIFAAARKMREVYFGKKVFLYGFVYFSTYCKNNCTFCYYRKDNTKAPRYRKNIDEILNTAMELKKSGVHLIDLTTGEDPYYTEHPERLAEIVKIIKEKVKLPVMVSPGVLDNRGIELMYEAGADWYALYQESHSEKIFEKLRINQSYKKRMDAKLFAKEKGMLIEEGLLTGAGSSTEDDAESFLVMKEIEASQVRTMTFIPQDGAPLKSDELSGDFTRELLNIAIMRLLFPDCLIPASLDVDGISGLEDRLMAGANVVTSIIPPMEGYAGVANSVRDIDEGYRTVKGIQSTLKKCGVEAAFDYEYKEWIEKRKSILKESKREAI